MFSVRNRMVNIPANFSSQSEKTCKCGIKEDLPHIYECLLLGDNKLPTIPYEKIYNGNLKEQQLVYKKVSENLKTREEQSLPCGRFDPLLCTVRDK